VLKFVPPGFFASIFDSLESAPSDEEVEKIFRVIHEGPSPYQVSAQRHRASAIDLTDMSYGQVSWLSGWGEWRKE